MINFFGNFLKTRKITKFNSNLFGKKFGNTKKILLCEISHNKVTQSAFSYLICVRAAATITTFQRTWCVTEQ